MAKRISCGCVIVLLLLGVGAFGWWNWLQGQIAPTTKTKPFYVRFESQTPFLEAMETLQKDAVVRNPSAFNTYAKLKRKASPIPSGTYRLNGGMSANQILLALKHPVVQMVRLPETNWAARTANVLQEHDVAKAADYMALVHTPQVFQKDVDFPLPKDSLEGYLYPDTYDLPP